jgi:hypothetical protein
VGLPVGRIDYGEAASDLGGPLPVDGDGRRRPRRSSFAALGVLLAGALVAVLVWQSTGSPSPVTHVRYVNDTGTRVVVSPCGAKQRCIIEAGASARQRVAPKDAVSWPSSTRVVNARTLRLLGCLPYLAEGTVRLSDADIGPDC